MNHILGIGMAVSRIVVRDCHEGRYIEKVLSAINNTEVGIITLFTIELPEVHKHDLVIHLNKDDCTPAIAEIHKSCYKVSERSR